MGGLAAVKGPPPVTVPRGAFYTAIAAGHATLLLAPSL